MSHSFDPYQEWLGLSSTSNYYELIRLSESESDPKKIRLAAERAITLVRSYQPGPHKAEWTQLLDVLRQVKAELSDPVRKKAYDNSLGHQDLGEPVCYQAADAPSHVHAHVPLPVPAAGHAGTLQDSDSEPLIEELDLSWVDAEPTAIAVPTATVVPTTVSTIVVPTTVSEDPAAAVESCSPAPSVERHEIPSDLNNARRSLKEPARDQWEMRIPAVKLRQKRTKVQIVLVVGLCLLAPIAAAGVFLKDELRPFINTKLNILSDFYHGQQLESESSQLDRESVGVSMGSIDDAPHDVSLVTSTPALPLGDARPSEISAGERPPNQVVSNSVAISPR